MAGAAGSIVSAAIVAGALWLRGWSPARQVSEYFPACDSFAGGARDPAAWPDCISRTLFQQRLEIRPRALRLALGGLGGFAEAEIAVDEAEAVVIAGRDAGGL